MKYKINLQIVMDWNT